ncbi:electron transport complex, RnfABCDGE type, B subunit [Halobacteroides halobius DSM 5150]|uniref:Ion-translocating oxidoreductase complex subunit B n=1 Tax=Halobacteroides halobius (strain ATCC 35273 / DSM 5150 / MD-1) TaxID=748449 RepID=L0KBJ1_HALHC|nr:RnfABCDGE type electron transport complex subunit B [Halobacteroides halobius]AGB41905.1 electron transport complex, RnfABCDGE type, B subunit [Halobacteroides halobius DSM 5150]
MNLTIFKSAVSSMGILGAVFAGGLAYASVKFSVDEDPRKGKIEEALPGANCGACGYPGCFSFAEGVVKEEVAVDGCPVGGEEVADKVAQIMGVDAKSSKQEVKVAQVLCQGGNQETTMKANYEGVATCQAANMEVNIKSCSYGCLGFGDCEAVCQFDAIYMTDNGLPKIDEKKCTGCEECVIECPRNIISLMSNQEAVTTKCVSTLGATEVKQSCDIGCIGCSLCAKKCPVDAIEMEDNLPVVDAEECIGCNQCVKVCPTDAMVETPFEVEDTSTSEDSGQIVIGDECVGCTLCTNKCPVDAISGEQGGQHEIDQVECIQCEQCIAVCPKETIGYE